MVYVVIWAAIASIVLLIGAMCRTLDNRLRMLESQREGRVSAEDIAKAIRIVFSETNSEEKTRIGKQ